MEAMPPVKDNSDQGVDVKGLRKCVEEMASAVYRAELDDNLKTICL